MQRNEHSREKDVGGGGRILFPARNIPRGLKFAKRDGAAGQQLREYAAHALRVPAAGRRDFKQFQPLPCFLAHHHPFSFPPAKNPFAEMRLLNSPMVSAPYSFANTPLAEPTSPPRTKRYAAPARVNPLDFSHASAASE